MKRFISKWGFSVFLFFVNWHIIGLLNAIWIFAGCTAVFYLSEKWKRKQDEHITVSYRRKVFLICLGIVVVAIAIFLFLCRAK